ncbi:Uncharacterized protein FWK35_00010436, partial [Aphis craccivora]
MTVKVYMIHLIKLNVMVKCIFFKSMKINKNYKYKFIDMQNISHLLNKHLVTFSFFLDSERSDECIDFTMIITSRNNAPISNYGNGFQCKSEYPWCIIE